MAIYFTVSNKQKVSSVGGNFVGKSVVLPVTDNTEDAVFDSQILYKNDVASGTITPKDGDLDFSAL